MVDRIIPRRRENMRSRIRTIIVAVVIVGLAMALVVQSLRAQRQQAIINTVLAKERELMDAYELARLAELRAKEALQQSSHVDGDQKTSQKPPSQGPYVAP
jgi:type II secretory pathway pseudopilin PulG